MRHDGEQVQQVMTPLSDVFSLPMNAVLDFETMTRVVESGHSRIPVTEQVGRCGVGGGCCVVVVVVMVVVAVESRARYMYFTT